MMHRTKQQQPETMMKLKNNSHSAKNEEPSRGKRLFRINSLIDAIANCEWEDAEHVISAYVDEARAGFPPLNPDDLLPKDDATFCSEMISFEDLRAYYTGCGIKGIRERLNQAINDKAQPVTALSSAPSVSGQK